MTSSFGTANLVWVLFEPFLVPPKERLQPTDHRNAANGTASKNANLFRLAINLG
jgi:hypothetical protein